MFTENSDAWSTDKQAGLCADCVNAQHVPSINGAVFVLCRLSKTDSRYRKYPALPVLSCAGFMAVNQADA